MLGLVSPLLLLLPLGLTADDNAGDHDASPGLTTLSNAELVRSYLVYTICSLPALVDVAPDLLEWTNTTAVPGVKWVADKIVRYTFFDQFCGGETLAALESTIDRMSSNRIGTLLTYSVEAESRQPSAADMSTDASPVSLLHTQLVSEIQRSVEFAASVNETKGVGSAVAVKVSGLMRDPDTLKRVSEAIVARSEFTSQSHQATHASIQVVASGALNLRSSDQAVMQELLEVLRRAGHRARDGRVKLIIDAEQSWLQPAIDLLVIELSREINTLSKPPGPTQTADAGQLIPLQADDVMPTIYGTLQTSLRRSEPMLKAMLEDAFSNKYALGVKVVRGAYIDAEHAAASHLGIETPAWSSKAETDACFDRCAGILAGQIAAYAQAKGQSIDSSFPEQSVAAMFASHNRASVATLLSLFEQLEIATAGGAADQLRPGMQGLSLRAGARERICFGQLYGMANDVTDRLARGLETMRDSNEFPSVYKYVPYGPVEKVMPYLVRRGKENKSVMAAGSTGGGAAGEKMLVVAEMRRRVRAWLYEWAAWSGTA